jgi:hypothetical protein
MKTNIELVNNGNGLQLEKDVFRTDRSISFTTLVAVVNREVEFSVTLPENTEMNYLTVLRDTLLAYVAYNPNMGYVQGMSDLMSTMLFVMKDEIKAFWCFVRIMDQMQNNFSETQTGMQGHLDKIDKLVAQLDPPLYANLASKHSIHFFFCFRWFLILFKREFNMNDIIYLWEVS